MITCLIRIIKGMSSISIEFSIEYFYKVSAFVGRSSISISVNVCLVLLAHGPTNHSYSLYGIHGLR